jgi:sulfur-oxidizing protein SoxX
MKALRLAALASAALAACAVTRDGAAFDPAELDGLTQKTIHSSFHERGIAKLDRLDQTPLQRACSAQQPPSPAIVKQLEAAAQATIQWPKDGVYLGDWREGEKLAQNGRGMTWTDPAGAPSGGNCYNCHQMTKAELSFGTVGPSLYQYGKLRGVTNPSDPAAAPIIQYTWGKLWNSKATSACSTMPRFGDAGVLTQAQIRDLMALLLDPRSPVNSQ